MMILQTNDIREISTNYLQYPFHYIAPDERQQKSEIYWIAECKKSVSAKEIVTVKARETQKNSNVSE